MKNNLLRNTIAVLLSCFASLIMLSSIASAAEEKQISAIEKGKDLAFNRKKGNCLACHYIQGGTLMGTMGPGLVAMKQRFPDKKKLTAQIFDARTNNQNTIMPPFGAHGILDDEEIDLIVDWLYTL